MNTSQTRRPPRAGPGAPMPDVVDANLADELAAGVTNAQGRIAALYPEDKPIAAGDYRIVFQTGEHYARLKQDTFFPRIPVEFRVTAPAQHYHVPLLLSPFGYSTYRGN
jgi:5-hydroxyisourate hydrolase